MDVRRAVIAAHLRFDPIAYSGRPDYAGSAINF